jgi:predicted GH43/DUF377 family glycosyl hydrolase
VILPAYRGRWNVGWTKPGAIVPQKINGRWWMYYLGDGAFQTDQEILLIYNGADQYLVYSTGWALFDKNDPSKVLARSEAPLFGAYLPWERTGHVPNVVFVEGMIVEGKDLTFSYGAGDKMIGSALTRLRWSTSAG